MAQTPKPLHPHKPLTQAQVRASLERLYMRLIDRSDAKQLVEVRQILDSGVLVNTRFDNADHDTPLTHAAGFGQAAVVRLLLERGAKPDAQNDNGETALWNATNADLSESGESPQPVTPAQRKAWTAAYVGIIRALLARKANPNLGNDSGVTPLGVGAYRGRTAEVAALLEGGANPNLRDRFGKTPLEWAAYNGNAKGVRLLQAHGARLSSGRTLPSPHQKARDAALQGAVEQNKMAAARMWLARGGDPNALVNNSSGERHPADARACHTAALRDPVACFDSDIAPGGRQFQRH